MIFTLSRPLVYSANGGAEGASVENAPWVPKIIPYKKKENWNWLNVITFNSEDNTWTVEYPWIKDHSNLPDNWKVAMAKLAATERRLRKKRRSRESVWRTDNGCGGKKCGKETLKRRIDKLHRSYALHCSPRSAHARIQINSCPYSFQQQRKLYWTRLKMSFGQRVPTCSTTC